MTVSELTEVLDRIRGRSPVLADITVIAGWTGLRWGDLRVVRVGDLGSFHGRRSG
jgi:hypothetical protein